MELIEDEYISTVEVKEFIPPPFGESKPEEFNILYNVKLKKPKEEPIDPKKKKM